MSQSSPNEQRRFTRIPFVAQTRLSDANGAHWDCDLVDISLHGALVTRPADWSGEPQQHFDLSSSLSDDNTVIAMEVSVAHVEDDHIGFVCVHLDLDSATHLRRLVELNLGDEALLERELLELLGEETPKP